jgi:hypothetical protein
LLETITVQKDIVSVSHHDVDLPYLVFYIITCVSSESSLGCSKDRINQVEYSIFTNNSETFQMRTGNILNFGDNVLIVDVDLGKVRDWTVVLTFMMENFKQEKNALFTI